ncbi:N2227-like protein-domain-containing protein [Endogone sp. FLAS-F59071]|nr:N2227-like protein-domain-containing protein [Endogone sp. FLAS-F59071]|eukprot:RUS15456.1 N2227-like protein-domain-containing protein [Endogone sp. FLAS-F59071]
MQNLKFLQHYRVACLTKNNILLGKRTLMDPDAHDHPHAHNGAGAHSHSHHDDDDSDGPTRASSEERSHFRKVVAAFTHYRTHASRVNQRRRHDFHALPQHHKRLLPGFLARLDAVDDAIRQNAAVLKEIVADSELFMEGEGEKDVAENSDFDSKPPSGKESITPHVSEFDMDKLRSTMKQFVRDWAEEGKPERNATYGPIMRELESRFGHMSLDQRGEIRVLVPGAGLGRLAFDIAMAGFSCQGEPYSKFYHGVSCLVLTNSLCVKSSPKLWCYRIPLTVWQATSFRFICVSRVCQHAIYPFIHSFSNVRRADDQLRPVMIPDVLPGNLPRGGDFSMVAGDFLEVYGLGKENLEKWDVVVTCFFIDTAKNVMEYMDVVRRVLKPNGVWINIGAVVSASFKEFLVVSLLCGCGNDLFSAIAELHIGWGGFFSCWHWTFVYEGPLLYHFENTPGEMSVELSLEEVKDVARKIGFRFEAESTVATTYTSSPDTMLRYQYECAFWTAVKERSDSDAGIYYVHDVVDEDEELEESA